MMPFGKYRDQSFDEIPDSYFRWLLEQDWLFDDLRADIEAYLSGKRVQQAAETAKKKKKAKKNKKKHSPEEVKLAIYEYAKDNRECARIILINPQRFGGLESLMAQWALAVRFKSCNQPGQKDFDQNKTAESECLSAV